MDRNPYRDAFSALRPSGEVSARLRDIPDETLGTVRRIRLGTIVAAVAAAVLLLTGAVYAAAHWFRLDEAPTLTEPSRAVPVDGPTQPTDPPRPQTGIVLENPDSADYVGFRLNGFGLDGADTRGTNTMEALLRTRGLTAEVPLDGVLARYFAYVQDEEILCVEMLFSEGLGYPRYFSRYETTLVKEDRIGALDAVWLTIEEPWGTSFHLFCHSANPECTLVVSSSVGFARAEAAANAITLVDTGAAMPRTDVKTVWALRVPALPDGMTCWQTAAMDRKLANAVLADPTQKLDELYDSLELSRSDGSGITMSVRSDAVDWDAYPSYKKVRVGTVNGHPARWYHANGQSDPDKVDLYPYDTVLVVAFEAEGCKLELRGNMKETTLHPGELEKIAALFEPVSIEILEEAPAEFQGLAFG